ncbi:MAG: hypothetical protein HY816_01090 [Candidatus Wallbacteria bacterium]|nr:hypothetical protein [Candidatus Wallbacteria bacterium]
MRRLAAPALLSLAVLTAPMAALAGDSWLTALERHVRSGLVYGYSEPFELVRSETTTRAGFVISGERIHLENGILTAHFNRVQADDGTDLQNVDVMSKLSLSGGFLQDPVRNALEAFLAYMDMTAQKVQLAFTIPAAPASAKSGAPNAPVEILTMPVRDMKMTMRQKVMEMTLKSIISVRAVGKANYRPAEMKIDCEITGAWSGPIPIPQDLLFHTLSNSIHYPFIEVHKPYVTIDIGYFLEPAPTSL